jgi:hypothetical protein
MDDIFNSEVDIPIVLHAFQLLSAFRFHTEIYRKLGKSLSKVVSLISQNPETVICSEGFEVLSHFVFRSESLVPIILTKTPLMDFMQALSSETPVSLVAFTRFLRAVFENPRITFASRLDCEHRALLLEFLVLPLGTQEEVLVQPAASVLSHLILDRETVDLCLQLSFYEQCLALYEGPFTFETKTSLFQCLCHMVTFSSELAMEFLIGSGFCEFFSSVVDSFSEKVTDEIVRAVCAICASGRPEWMALILDNLELVETILRIEYIPEDLMAVLSQG